MYIDIVVLAVIIIGIVIYFRNFSSFVFIVAITDIMLRILNFLKLNIGLKDFKAFLNKYFPDSIFGIIDNILKEILI